MQGMQRQDGPIRIVTMYKFEPEEIRTIQAAAPKAKVEIVIAQSREEFRKLLPTAEVVYGDIARGGTRLRTEGEVDAVGRGGNRGDGAGVKEHPVVVTNYARIFAPGISETAIGLLLCLTRGITTHYMPQFAKRQMKPVGTPKSADHVELVGRTMGDRGDGRNREQRSRGARTTASTCGWSRPMPKPMPKPEYVERAARSDVVRGNGAAGPTCWWRGAAHARRRNGCSTSRSSER